MQLANPTNKPVNQLPIDIMYYICILLIIQYSTVYVMNIHYYKYITLLHYYIITNTLHYVITNSIFEQLQALQLLNCKNVVKFEAFSHKQVKTKKPFFTFNITFCF